MRVRNTHAAGLSTLAAGEVGELDENNVAVIAWLAAGMLVEEKPEAKAPDKKKAP